MFKILISKIVTFLEVFGEFIQRKLLFQSFSKTSISKTVHDEYLYQVENDIRNVQFNPSILFPTPYLQTCFTVCLKIAPKCMNGLNLTKYFAITSCPFTFKDNGVGKYIYYKRINKDSDKIVIIHPGLNFYEDDYYINYNVFKLHKINCDVIVVCTRGHSTSKEGVRNTFDWANLHDMQEYYAYFKTLNKRIISMGFSAGGNFICNYITRTRDHGISYAVIVNSPLDIYTSTVYCCPIVSRILGQDYLKSLNKSLSWVEDKYSKYSTDGKSIKEQLKQTYDMKWIDRNINRIIFNDGEVVDYEEYLQIKSGLTYLNNENKTPIMIVADRHDMAVSIKVFNEQHLSKVSNIIYVETSHSGHLGGVESNLDIYVTRLIHQFVSSMENNK